MAGRHRAIVATTLTILFASFGAATVLAQDELLAGKVRAGEAVTVGADETVPGDLYVFAGNVVVDGTVEGDLVAAGGQVVVDGRVDGDVLAAAGTVSVGGSVAGDVRVAGGQLRIDGQVAEDVLAGGGEVTLGSAGLVGGDLIVSGGQLAIQGTVQGNAVGSAGTYSRTGSIGGSEDVTVSPPDRAAPAPSTANVVLDALRHYVVVLLFGAIGLWLAPRAMATLERRLRTEPLGAFFWGLLGVAGFIAILIVVLILMILLAIAFGSLGFDSLVALDVFGGLILVGAICVGFAFVAGFLADAIVGLALGRLVAEEESEPRWRPFAVLAVGAGVVVLVTALPVVGPWLKLLVVILGLGALLAALWARRRPAVAAVFPVAPAAPSV